MEDISLLAWCLLAGRHSTYVNALQGLPVYHNSRLIQVIPFDLYNTISHDFADTVLSVLSLFVNRHN